MGSSLGLRDYEIKLNRRSAAGKTFLEQDRICKTWTRQQLIYAFDSESFPAEFSVDVYNQAKSSEFLFWSGWRSAVGSIDKSKIRDEPFTNDRRTAAFFFITAFLPRPGGPEAQDRWSILLFLLTLVPPKSGPLWVRACLFAKCGKLGVSFVGGLSYTVG